MRDAWMWLIGLLGVGGLAGGLAFWALGGAALARIVEQVVGALAPLLKSAAELAGEVLQAVGRYLLKGVMGIFKQTPTLVTVVLMGAMLWGGQRFAYERLEDRLENRQAAINEAYSEIAVLRKKLKMPPRAAAVAPSRERFPWPWELF